MKVNKKNKKSDCISLQSLQFYLFVDTDKSKDFIKICKELDDIHDKSLYESKDVAVFVGFYNLNVFFIFGKVFCLFISEF